MPHRDSTSSSRASTSSRSFVVVVERRADCAGCGSSICQRTTRTTSPFPERRTACSLATTPSSIPKLPLQLLVDGHAAVDLRLRHGDPRARAEEAAGDPERLRPDEVRGPARSWRRPATASQVPVSILLPRRQRRLDGTQPAAALRLRLVRRHHGADVQLERAEPRRPRLRLRHRPHPRRAGDGPPVVRRRQDDEEEEHVQRFHRRRRLSGQARVHASRTGWSPTAAAPAAC